MRSLILSIRFLTIVPIPGHEADGPGALGRAAPWFPAVGLALGGALAGIDKGLMLACPPLLAAAWLLVAWIAITGALHLDGLADCLDGLGSRDAERRLAAMRDSRVGAFGAIGLMLSILLALGALASISPGARARVLILAPALGRLAPLLSGRWVAPVASDQGMGAGFLRSLPRWSGPAWLVILVALAGALLGVVGMLLTVCALAAAVGCSAWLAHGVGGLTGDVLGAAVVIAELVWLLLAASSSHVGLF